MVVKKRLLKREIAGESFLVPLGTTVYDSNGLFILSDLGSFIWDRLPDAQGPDEILQAILEEYEVEESIAKADLDEFLDRLYELKIL